MSNLSDRSFKSNIFDKSMKFNMSKQSQLFSDKNTDSETSFVGNKTNLGFTGMLTRQSSVNSQMSQLFKVPNFDHIPVKKATVKSIKSPLRVVQTGRVNNDLKSHQSKMSMIPRPSFINSRKSLHGARSSQLNARKELIKRMVYLAECSLKEKVEVKKTTPVKVLAGLTPRKTPRSGNYFILPELKKKEVEKVEDLRNPIEDLVKKEIYAYSVKSTPLSEKKKECIKQNEKENLNFLAIPKEQEKAVAKSSPDRETRFLTILSHCKSYNIEIRKIHEKIKILDESFEKKLKDIPDYRVYNDFCSYQFKKEELYKQLQTLESELSNFVSTNTKIGNKLTAYIKKKQEFFEEQINLHKNFEQSVNSAWEKCQKKEDEKKRVQIEEKPKMETPKLRRSLRLSNIKRNKLEERTPMTKRLTKLDSKSKGIQKSGKI